MKYIYNITFVCAPHREKNLLEYLKQEFLPEVTADGYSDLNLQLRKVVEVGGEKPEPDHGVSIALSAEFDCKANGLKWHDSVLTKALADFQNKFRQEALYFITLLEDLSII